MMQSGSTAVDGTGFEAGGEAEVVLGGGCFWCLEAVFQEMEGVVRVKSGYAAGHTEAPTYRAVCTGQTGHAEVVRVTYDPKRLALADLLRVFFTLHDPTTLNRQGADAGTQYRSVVLTASAEQDRVAREVVAEIGQAGVWPHPIVTVIEPLRQFFPAEAEHDSYFLRNPGAGYCRAVVLPKVVHFRRSFADRVKFRAA